MSNKRTEFNDEIKIKAENTSKEDEVCRLCVERSCEYSSVFRENLHEALISHFGLMILKTDNWPKVICSECLIKTRTCLNFITTIRQSEPKLRNLYGEFENAEQKPTFEEINVPEITLKTETDTTFDPLVDQKKEESNRKSTKRVLRKSKTTQATQDTQIKQVKIPKLEHQEEQEDFQNDASDFEENPHGQPTKSDSNRCKKKVQDKIRKIEEFFKLTCDKCEKTFSKFRELQQHHRTKHNQEGYIICCNSKMKRPSLIFEHLNYHRNPQAFKCDECSKSFKNKEGLRLHTAKSHSPAELHQFHCPNCPKTFMIKEQLKKHAFVHISEAEKAFICPQCNKAFAVKSNLQSHIRQTHEQIPYHVCEICAKTFKQKDNFLRHQRTHAGQNVPKEPCLICGKLLTDKYLLKKHMKLHSETGQIFQCPICHKDSVSSRALKKHIRCVHINERKHKCNLCEAAFKTPLALREHTASHSSSQILYTCLYCPKQFNSNANMYVHQKRKHPEEYEASKIKKSLETTVYNIYKTDNWPKNICSECLNKARLCVGFISVVRENEEKLRELYGEWKDVELKPDFEMINLSISIKTETDPLESNKITKIPKTSIEPRRSSRSRKCDENPNSESSDDQECYLEESSESEKPKSKSKKSQKKIHTHISEENTKKIEEFFRMECELCEESFRKFAGLRSHYRKVHNRRGYVVCCGVKLNHTLKILDHLNLHKNPDAFKCAECGKNYKNKVGLQFHMENSHTPADRHKYKCPNCPKTFMTIYRYKSHLVVHLPADEKKHICPQCGKAFSRKNNLQIHVRQTHEEMSYLVCELCAKMFKNKHNYLEHKRNHHPSAGEKLRDPGPKLQCSMCEKSFSNKTLLRRHLKIHNEAGQIFKCEICGKELKSSRTLWDHVKFVHKSEKKHKCSLCNAAFAKPIYLKEHLATHSSNQILYTCAFCPKQYNSNGNMYSHYKQKHPTEYEELKRKKASKNSNK
ncbi:hypothetical protein DMENIID0001_150080 [Sergentomyia squamirostris]